MVRMDFTFSVQNIFDGHGFAVSATGMVIVFFVLAAISIVIALVPHLLVIVNRYFPEKKRKTFASDRPQSDDSVVAAISAALHRQNS
ncbi:MAG: sodium pump decarboxylase subunit gamma [Chitinivibrionales bacterium]|nr:sodium pump decarboxylase subunit gamma [Chitinivibrionales bacterium]